MVIKGTSVSGARRLATHLMRTDTNERAEVRELKGVAADDLRGALLEMEAVAAGTRSTKPFYHASINTRADEPLTEQQRATAIDRLERSLGLSGQSRIVVVHLKEGREHCHIVWSRIDLERMAAISDSHNFRKHEEVARSLEREFGHERVQGAHVEREGKVRPERTPSHDEMLATAHGAVSPQEAKALMTDIWRRTDSGQSFRAELEKQDWILARGDRRDFVAIDPHGGTHSIARRVEGAKAKDIRERMKDIDAEALPSVAQARMLQKQREAEAERVGATAQETIVQADQEKQVVSEKPQQQEAPSPPVVRQQIEEQTAKAVEPSRAERTEPQQPEPRQSPPVELPDVSKVADKGLQVADTATGVASKLADFVTGLLAGPSSPREQPLDMHAFATDAQARKEQQLARLAARDAVERDRKAIENIRKDMEAGKSLSAADIRNLTREHQEQIRHKGDDAVREMVRDAQKYAERYWKGDERER